MDSWHRFGHIHGGATIYLSLIRFGFGWVFFFTDSSRNKEGVGVKSSRQQRVSRADSKEGKKARAKKAYSIIAVLQKGHIGEESPLESRELMQALLLPGRREEDSRGHSRISSSPRRKVKEVSSQGESRSSLKQWIAYFPSRNLSLSMSSITKVLLIRCWGLID